MFNPLSYSALPLTSEIVCHNESVRIKEIHYCSSQDSSQDSRQDSSQDSSQGLDQKNAKIRGIAIIQCFYFIRRYAR